MRLLQLHFSSLPSCLISRASHAGADTGGGGEGWDLHTASCDLSLLRCAAHCRVRQRCSLDAAPLPALLLCQLAPPRCPGRFQIRLVAPYSPPLASRRRVNGEGGEGVEGEVGHEYEKRQTGLVSLLPPLLPPPPPRTTTEPARLPPHGFWEHHDWFWPSELPS